MTIAACYLSNEGVVFGADSTTTTAIEGDEHHFNYGQKVFEVGEGQSLAISTWGLGALPDVSYRTLVARFADQLAAAPSVSVLDAASRWSNLFWSEYSAQLAVALQRFRELTAKTNRTADENQELAQLSHNTIVGLCIGGHLKKDRTPEAFELVFSFDQAVPPSPKPLLPGVASFQGWPVMINRLIWGIDAEVYTAILNSGKWAGSEDELVEVALSKRFIQPNILPLREAIDFIHSAIYTTIKAMKFSQFRPYCGGPIEIGVISSDRKFRWVTHKEFDIAPQETWP